MCSCFKGLWCGAILFVAALLALALPARADANNATVEYDFAYRLSGDRRVAPIQVFDDGSTTWLQYQPGQTLPAVFAEDASAQGGLRLAPYTRQGPYLVVDGVVRAIVMRIGSASARADYVGNAPRTGLKYAEPSASHQWPGGSGHNAVSASLNHTSAGPALPVRSAASVQSRGSANRAMALASRQPPGLAAENVVSNTRAQSVAGDGTSGVQGQSNARASSAGYASTPVSAHAAPVLEFDAALADGNMRRVLQRWSRQAGWRFDAEHWTVNVDIPLTGAASFGADFRNAVRGLLAATELADHPLQPCFYSNRVLRVIPVSQACDRTVSPLAPAVPLS